MSDGMGWNNVGNQLWLSHRTGIVPDRLNDATYMPRWLERHGFTVNTRHRVLSPGIALAAEVAWSGTLAPAAAQEIADRQSAPPPAVAPNDVLDLPVVLTLSRGGRVLVGTGALAVVIARNLTVPVVVTVE